MIEGEVTALLNKTRNYFDFIKSRLDSQSIVIKSEDANVLNSIDSYLKVVQEELGKRGGVQTEVHRNVVGNCIDYLERLDNIARDYKLLSGKSAW